MLNFIKENLFLWFIVFLLIVAPSFLFGAVQVVGYLLLGLFLLIVVGTLIFRWKLRKFTQSTQQGFGQQRQNNSKVKVDIFTTSEHTRATDKKVSSDVGDFIDFEEIKD